MSRLLISTFALTTVALTAVAMPTVAMPTALFLSGDPADIVAVAAPLAGPARAIGVAVAAGGQVAMLHGSDRIVLPRPPGPGFLARVREDGARLVVSLPIGGCAPAAPRNGIAA